MKGFWINNGKRTVANSKTYKTKRMKTQGVKGFYVSVIEIQAEGFIGFQMWDVSDGPCACYIPV